MNLEEVKELMSDAAAGISETGMRDIDAFMRQGGKRLKKDGVVPGTIGKRIYALEMIFPFDPRDPKNPAFNRAHKFHAPLSPETTVIYLKGLMRKNEELHAFYAEKGGFENPADYDVSEDKLTEQDWKVFGSYRTLLHYSELVCKSRMSGHGKYGRVFLSKCKFDEKGNPIEVDDAYQIAKLEVAIANQRIKEIKEEYKSGSKAGKPEKDMNEEIKVVWKGVKMTAPYLAGTIRVLVIPLNEDSEIEKPDEIEKNGLASFEFYSGGAKQSIEKIMQVFGRKKDRNFNYIECDINYPSCPDVEKDREPLESYQKKTENFDNPVERISDKIPKFDELYREFRDNQDIFCEEMMLNSVFNYRAIDSSVLLEMYKADLADRKEYIDDAAAKTYKDLIAKVDEALSDELMDKLIDSELPKAPQSLEDLAAPSEDDDNFEAEYGVSVLPEQEKEVVIE